MIITLKESFGFFAEDKTAAKAIREREIMPTLAKDETVILDFDEVRYATQSFIHALIYEPLHTYGEAILDKLEFKNCTEAVRTIIEIVVNYSLNPPVYQEG